MMALLEGRDSYRARSSRGPRSGACGKGHATRHILSALAAFAAAWALAVAPAWGDAAIEGVSWRGVRAFSPSDLEKTIGMERGAQVAQSEIDAAARALVDIYRAQGYLNASARLATFEKEEGFWLCAEVDEGRRYVVGDVSLQGMTLFTRDRLLDICPGLRRGAPFARESLERSFESLLRAYGELGYADCRVSPRSFAPDTAASVDFALEVAEGRKRVVEGISVSGGRTKPATATKLARLERGAAFDPWDLDQVRRRLASSGLFAEVNEPIVKEGSADSLVVIEIPVKEPLSSSVSGLFGYSGRDGGAVGFVDLDLGNIMGTGRSAGFRWEGSGSGLSSYGVGYTEPWLGGLPVSLELGLDHVTQDTTYSTTGLKADARVTAARGFSFTLGVGSEKTALAGPVGAGATRRTRLALRAGLEMDARDNAVDPRSGLLLGADGDWGSRHDGGPGYVEEESWNLTRVRLRSELYRRLGDRHGVFVGACWRKVLTDQREAPWDQLLRFGGASSIRGYREDQFRAEETRLFQIEHRVALGDGGSRLFVFTDLGFLRGRGAIEERLLGYGLGIRAATAGGVLGLDFALGKGDSWSDGKVHVRMTRTF